MTTIKSWISRNLSRIIVFIALAITVAFLLEKCAKETPSVEGPNRIVPQTTTRSKLNDSMNVVSNNALLASTQAQVRSLQSSLNKAIADAMKIHQQQASIEYLDRIVVKEIPGVPIQVPNKDGYPLKFKHGNKHMEQSYTIHSKDSSTIDSLSIYGRQHIVIGESGKWYQKKTYKVAISNENPYYLIDSLQTSVFKPTPKNQYSIGPIIMGNKNSLSGGVGISIRKGIFSITVGYKLF